MEEPFEKIEDAIFDFIYISTLNDATRRTAAASIKNDIMAEDSIKMIVREYAERVIEGKYPNLYYYTDQIHECIKRNKKFSAFTFGNSQKLINMTMKYLYVRYYDKVEREFFSCCHAPMDSLMRDKVYKLMVQKNKTPKFHKECAWSKMTKEATNPKYQIHNYEAYQEAVEELRGGYNKLEFDFKEWNK